MPSLCPENRRLLVIANLVMLLTIAIHDADHVRQARNWCYTIPLELWFINVAVYLPNTTALLFAARRSAIAPLMTSGASLFIGFEFAKVHLWKPSIAVWGIWNKNFFELGADAISWVVLVATVMIGVGTAMVGAYVTGSEKGRRAEFLVV